MAFKRTEGFRFAFGEPIYAKYMVLIDGKPQDLEMTKYDCEILDISPRGMKIFSHHKIGEPSNMLVQIEVHFILDEVLIKAVGDIVWTKPFGDRVQYGLVFDGQPKVEQLIVNELKLRRKKEVARR